jgi:hypothetical protein
MTLVIQLILVALTAFLIGWVLGRDTSKPFDIEDIHDYVQKNYPDAWAAYQNGVREGYAQGLRDGKD